VSDTRDLGVAGNVATGGRRGQPTPAVDLGGQETKLPERSISGGRALALGAVAAALHGAADLATYGSALLRPAYLRLEDAPDVFSTLSPVGVSIAASAVSGAIAALSVSIVEPTPRRRAVALGVVLAAFWTFSAFLTWLVWLETPAALALASLLLGAPRGLLIGWALARLCPEPAAS
jgi:hypothetical protein